MWTNEALQPDERGRFVRRATSFRDRVSADGSTGFAAAAGRYHLYVQNACGWSHRVLLVRSLKRLHDVISVTQAEPFMGDQGWSFAPGADLVHGARYLHEVYTAARPSYTGRVTVPALWDRETGTIVNNESSELIAMLDREFDAFTDARPQLYPEDRRAEVEAMIAANYQPVNNGVYRAGFAGTQEAYEEAVTELFARLDELERLLAGQRFLVGNTLTAADLCLFPTLFRFDAVYNLHFKCSVRRLRDYPNLWAYTRDVYQTPGVAEASVLEDAREHYYRSHESVNPRRIVPLGPTIDFTAPHGRERVGAPG